MITRQITTRAFLRYSPEQVWAVLADFASYSEWNPLNVEADGSAKAGAYIWMRFIDPGRPGRILKQRVQVTVAEEPRKIEWLGRVPLLFSGRHFFTLRPLKDGTELTHGEILSGLIPTFWGEERLKLQRRAYEEMNRALSRRLAQLSDPAGDQNHSD